MIVFLFVLFAILAFVSIGGGILMWAWNTVAPVLWAAAPHLNFWQALALWILIGTISGAIRGVGTSVAKEVA